MGVVAAEAVNSLYRSQAFGVGDFVHPRPISRAIIANVSAIEISVPVAMLYIRGPLSFGLAKGDEALRRCLPTKLKSRVGLEVSELLSAYCRLLSE